MSNLKLGVEVVSARNLMPTDGEGSASSYVELYFDGQKSYTNVKEKDLNPVWNENFDFNIKDPTNLQNLTLDATVYHNNKATHSKAVLGRVRLTGTSFVPYSDAVVSHYPLEKSGSFSRVKGELALKVCVMTDIPSVKSSNPVPAVESFVDFISAFSSGEFPNADLRMSQPQLQREAPNAVPNPLSNEKAESRHTFHHLPKENHHQQHSPTTTETQQPVKSSADVMKAEPQQPKNVSMYSAAPSQSIDYALKETSPLLGGGQIVGGRVIRAGTHASTYDLVVRRQFLFVRVVKGCDLPTRDISGSLDPYVEVRLGNYKGVTKYFEKNINPEWNEVFAFAFARDRIQSSVLEVLTKDKHLGKDDFVGVIRFDLNEVPTRVPPDRPLAPQLYRLEDKKGDKTRGELMLAVWLGTQADEAFPDACGCSDAVTPVGMSASAITSIQSKVYHAPMLWYVRVNVIEAQDLVPTEKNHFPEVYVKAQIGNQVVKTKPVQARAMNPFWNEDLLFVTAEPFEDHLILSVEDRVGSSCKDEIVGRVIIPLNIVDKRADDRQIHSRWYKLEKPVAVDVDRLKEDKFSGRLHLRVCLDGGYHVLDESTHYSSDLGPTAKQLWKPSIGVLELRILNAEGLPPMKTRNDMGTSDAYCVARYGLKWVRTRTIISSLNPKYNEQYIWEVYDPATVLTVAVFDNGQLCEKQGTDGNGDMKIGKVRIRISTLETGRVYTHSYPLLALHPSGVKKMGELHLAIRFSRKSLVNMLYMYTLPLLPKMHYIRPLSVMQLDKLRHHAVGIEAARLSRIEPPLRKEVVEYMCDVDSNLWSLRRSKVNFFRLMAGISGLIAVGKWFGDVCMWKNPITTVLVHVVFVMLVSFPGLILPAVFLFIFLKGIWNYRNRSRHPPHLDTRMSMLDSVHPDELDEEFDTFPTSRSPELVRMRYDRLRSIAGRLQTLVGDLATQAERIQSLLSWRDPPATAIFVMFSLVVAIVLLVMPFQLVVVIAGFYLMRHPRVRYRLPGAPINFFLRLPARTDSML